MPSNTKLQYVDMEGSAYIATQMLKRPTREEVKQMIPENIETATDSEIQELIKGFDDILATT